MYVKECISSVRIFCLLHTKLVDAHVFYEHSSIFASLYACGITNREFLRRFSAQAIMENWVLSKTFCVCMFFFRRTASNVHHSTNCRVDSLTFFKKNPLKKHYTLRQHLLHSFKYIKRPRGGDEDRDTVYIGTI